MHARTRSVLLLIALVVAAPANAGYTTTANLAPNPSFETLCSGRPCDWGFAVGGSPVSMVAGLPSSQRALRIQVLPEGSNTTYEYYVESQVSGPPGSTNRTPVLPGTTYACSALLQAALGMDQTNVLAELVVIEWGGPSTQEVLAYNTVAGTIDPTNGWKQLEGVITTGPGTNYVTIRMRMVRTGTYTWEDVRLRALDALFRTGMPLTCNQAPNADFEQGDATSFNDWNLLVDHAQPQTIATLAVERATPGNPGKFRSGSRAARMTVLQSNVMVYLSTDQRCPVSAGTSRMPVQGSTDYYLSANLLNDNSWTPPAAQPNADITVVQWDANCQPLSWDVLKKNYTAKDWQLMEGRFRTRSNTTHVSIRLLSATVGTYYWDDVVLARDLGAGQQCVDMRHYITQSSPGQRLTGEDLGQGKRWVIDGHIQKLPGGVLGSARHQYISQVAHIRADDSLVPVADTVTNDISGVWEPNGSSLRMGTHRDGSSTPEPPWRCFSEPGQICQDNVAYPPLTIEVSTYLPVIYPGRNPALGTDIQDLFGHQDRLRHTFPGAHESFPWKPFAVRWHNPMIDGSGEEVSTGFHRGDAYLFKRIVFGEQVGQQENVLVMEEEMVQQGFTEVQLNRLPGGLRMERYAFVPGFGNVVQQGLVDRSCYCPLNPRDPICANPPVPGDCDGVYDHVSTGIFNRVEQRDYLLDIP